MSNQALYPKSSPYSDTNIVNNYYLDVWNAKSIPAVPGDVYFTITPTYQYRPDLLAYDLYGDSRLWWVFAERNPNLLGPDPYFNFVSGISIYIPTLDTLRLVLGI